MLDLENATYGIARLTRVFEDAPVFDLNSGRRVVLFSDLHMGNGGPADDFRENGPMFHRVLRDHYLDESFELILNGDVEELQRFRLPAIQRRWPQVFDIFHAFEAETSLYRVIGNHDMAILDTRHRPETIYEGMRWRYGDNDLFILHGHQTAPRYEKRNPWIDFFLRYVANPLRIPNRTVSHNSRRKMKVERQVYHFSSAMKVASIIGHTHRPLFESLSKLDAIKFEIEHLCRIYPEEDARVQGEITERIGILRRELELLREDPDLHEPTESLYNSNLVVPCMFNSGCVIGSRGMTCLEIEGKTMRLVYWFDALRSQTYLQYKRYAAEQLPGTDYYRVVIKEDSLDYIFARIRLLA